MRLPAIERVAAAGPAPDRYVTHDGLRLGLTHWDAQMPFAVIVALHGMSDYSLMSLAPKRSGNFPLAVPDSAGIPKSVQDDMVIAPRRRVTRVA